MHHPILVRQFAKRSYRTVFPTVGALFVHCVALIPSIFSNFTQNDGYFGHYSFAVCAHGLCSSDQGQLRETEIIDVDVHDEVDDHPPNILDLGICDYDITEGSEPFAGDNDLSDSL